MDLALAEWIVLVVLMIMIFFPVRLSHFIALLFIYIKNHNPEMSFYQKSVVKKLDDIEKDPSIVKDHFSRLIIFFRVSGLIVLLLGILIMTR